ncbi:AEC family transporter [Granulicatella seriolae]|uniref:AEC family transporter n=1 Tax=Granulicatella seriolae TaxID=2967226 RepID=A0ABT1WN92_9LACT|nr:AEC family transporter [Granulicatella seriolae]
MAILTSLESIVPIILLIALGYFLNARGWFSEKFPADLSKYIMNAALPASVFVSVLKYLTRDKLLSLSSGLLYSFSSIIIGYAMAFALVKLMKIKPGRRGIFINTIVNANTIFIGLPLNIALFGDDSLPYFLVYYVTNTVSTWAIGAIIIAQDDPTKEKGSQGGNSFNWKKLLPAPLLGFLVALVFLIFDIPVPIALNSTLTYLGETVTPLSLIYIGISLQVAGLKSIHFDRDTIVAMLGRFVFAPLVMIGLVLGASGVFGALPTIEAHTLIIQSAVPALAVLPILASQSHGDVEYATNVVTISTLLFVIVVPLLNMLLAYL